ncbi:MAG: 3-methyl-2-oxobutanoate hydroxymethyltransferase [Chthoniobacterales bacterium]|nr:3-methyl-2-oxobutanoate hydroxymethyltransferase [Chthoniobacterales bacterium]
MPEPAELFRNRKGTARKIAALTAYDYPTARLVDEAGIDLILVGDSLGMVVLGYPDTTMVNLGDMERHTGAVARGVKTAVVITDLPIDTYRTPAHAVASAQRLVAAGAHGVKLEGGSAVAAQIRALTAAGIPVLAHIGMLPQHIREEGGYRVKGRTPDEAEAIRRDGEAVQEAGAFAVVMEIIIPGLAAEITSSLKIPTIGIGSGEGCDGQILVLHDLIGLYPWFRPKFAKQRADTAAAVTGAVREYIAAVHGDSDMTPP